VSTEFERLPKPFDVQLLRPDFSSVEDQEEGAFVASASNRNRRAKRKSRMEKEEQESEERKKQKMSKRTSVAGPQ